MGSLQFRGNFPDVSGDTIRSRIPTGSRSSIATYRLLLDESIDDPGVMRRHATDVFARAQTQNAPILSQTSMMGSILISRFTG